MTGRERVLSALDFKQPDRPPLDLGGHRSSGISAVAYSNLRKYLKLDPRPVRIMDMIQQLAIVDDDVLDLFGIDTIEMGRGFLKDDRDWKDWVLPDGTPCQIPFYINVEKSGGDWRVFADDGVELGIQKEGCLYFEQTYFPLMRRNIEEDDFADLEYIAGRTVWTGVPHPGAHLPLDAAGLSELARGAKALRESTDRAAIGLFGGNMFEVPQWFYRIDNYLTFMGLYPDAVHRLSEKLCGIYMRNLEKWLGAVGPYIDVVLFGDDLGAQNGPMISPAMYRELIKPYHSRLWHRAKELADVKVLFHTCGSIRPLLGDLIEAGVDAVNPVQLSCANMDSGTLKKEFGDRLVFWGGGCDTQDVLPFGSPADVAAHVKRQAAVLGSGGGFVCQAVHNIQANVPPENIVAMLKSIV